jgi:hypothetical protein
LTRHGQIPGYLLETKFVLISVLLGVPMKSRIKVVLLAALSGSLSTMAQAAVTIGSLTVTTPANVGTIASGGTLLVGDLGGLTNLLGLNPNLYNSSTTATKTFFDDFVFTIAGSSVSSISASLNSATLAGISGFSESLYSGGVPAASYTATGTNPLSAANLIGTTTGNTLSFSNLAAGTYTLQFSGTLAAANSLLLPTVGAYASLVSVTAVPEPESYALLLAGMGMMGYLIRRRGTKQA